jgi:hypothetical protein
MKHAKNETDGPVFSDLRMYVAGQGWVDIPEDRWHVERADDGEYRAVFRCDILPRQPRIALTVRTD